jgi:hypothetical protein
MTQLNVNMTPEFEAALSRFMRMRGIRKKSDAIRIAIAEGVERGPGRGAACRFSDWLGAATREPLNPSPRFRSDDEIWG